jgi:hypothetical protein
VRAETTRCQSTGHPEFRLVCDDHVTSQLGIPWLVSWLEERVLAGERFHPGESVQIGWMFDQIVGRPDGSLGISEPDFKAMPVAWADCITLTLRHLWFQKEVAASVAQAATYPSYRQAAVVCSRLRGASAIVMHRDEPTNLDSGWFIGCHDDDHDHQDVTQLVSASLYEVAVSWDQRFIAYAALPTGSNVVTAGQGPPVITLHDKLLEVVPGSILSSFGKLS